MPIRPPDQHKEAWKDQAVRRARALPVKCQLTFPDRHPESFKVGLARVEYRKASAVMTEGRREIWAGELGKVKQWLFREKADWAGLAERARQASGWAEAMEEGDKGYRTPAWQITGAIREQGRLDTMVGPTECEVDPTFRH